ncbi:AKT-interacting protein-like [Ciona intestinalis]
MARHVPTKPSDQPPAKSYGPFFLEYSLMAEYNLLQKQNLPGMYLMPSAKTPLLWFGVIFIRQGLYQTGVFKFCVVIPSNYPDGKSPQIIFDHPPFHPLIDPKNGKLDVDRAFVTWKRNVNHIWNVLLYTRRIFYKIDVDLPLNPEAAALYENKLTHFKSKVVESIECSKLHLYDDPKTNDPHELRFIAQDARGAEEAQGTQHDQRKHKMLSSTPQLKQNPNGLSWVASGSNSPFTKQVK